LDAPYTTTYLTAFTPRLFIEQKLIGIILECAVLRNFLENSTRTECVQEFLGDRYDPYTNTVIGTGVDFIDCKSASQIDDFTLKSKTVRRPWLLSPYA